MVESGKENFDPSAPSNIPPEMVGFVKDVLQRTNFDKAELEKVDLERTGPEKVGLDMVFAEFPYQFVPRVFEV